MHPKPGLHVAVLVSMSEIYGSLKIKCLVLECKLNHLSDCDLLLIRPLMSLC